jgi:hypothetical protein
LLTPMGWSRDALPRRGFTGFVPFAELPSADVPTAPGAYVVLGPVSVLLIAWQLTPGVDPKDVESRLITEFVTSYGQRPFANRRN